MFGLLDRHKLQAAILIPALWLAGCGLLGQSEPIASPTSAATADAGLEDADAQSSPTPAPTALPDAPLPTPTTQPPATVTPLPATQPAEPTSTNMPASPTPQPPTATPDGQPIAQVEYQVAFVEEDDLLNVRDSVGVQGNVVGRLPNGVDGVMGVGNTQMLNGSLWVETKSDNSQGWVNSYYLTEAVSPAEFCADPAATETLNDFLAQIEGGEVSDGFSQAVNAGRGLRIRTSWWNPEIHLTELENLFADEAALDWGREPAGGEDREITGSVNEVIAPLLADDLGGEFEIGCNEILHGNTAGLVQLPAAYEGINYFSLYRPAPEGSIGFDWGTWVVGIEKWEGDYFVSFLVHYQWEI